MKTIERRFGDYFYKKTLKPIRCKRDIIVLLLETLKLINDEEQEISNGKGKFLICIDKMSRIFYDNGQKIFSFCFPFMLEKREYDNYKIYDGLTDMEITDQLISLLLSIFERDGRLEESFESVMDFVIESAEDYEYKSIDDIWRLLTKLWYMEDGYIRYDYDPEHMDEKKHPLNHFDINYSSETTYKIGLHNSLRIDEMKDLLDTTTNCAYLSMPEKYLFE